MRITDRMMTNRMLSNINRGLVLLDKYNTQASSGKKIQKPSDDPIISSRALRYRVIVSDTEQYLENVSQADSWAKVTESAINNINDIIQNMRELCVQGASDTYTTEDRAKIITQYKSLLEQLESELNTTYMGRHIFSGFKTNQPPIIKNDEGENILNPEIYGANVLDEEGNITDTIESIDGQYINIAVGSASNISVNSLATNIFTQTDYENFHSLDEIYKTITSEEFAALEGEEKAEEEARLNIRENLERMITVLDDFAKNLSIEHTKIGVKINKIELIESRLSDDKVNYQTLQSENEDVDLAEVSMNYNAASAAYSAALKVGMSISQMTLVDYL